MPSAITLLFQLQRSPLHGPEPPILLGIHLQPERQNDYSRATNFSPCGSSLGRVKCCRHSASAVSGFHDPSANPNPLSLTLKSGLVGKHVAAKNRTET